MSDSSTGPLVIGLLFILRCLIPLGILFGISYLLQRLGLVNNHAEEKKTESAEDPEGTTPMATKPPGQVPQVISGQPEARRKSAAPKKRSRTL